MIDHGRWIETLTEMYAYYDKSNFHTQYEQFTLDNIYKYASDEELSAIVHSILNRTDKIV